MIPQSFEYFCPETVSEAIALLHEHGEGAKILSGGQSLIPMMKMRLARPEYIVDINRIADLHYVKEEDGFLKIGGLTRESDLEASSLIRSKYPIILDTAAIDRRSTSSEYGDSRRKSGSRRSCKRSPGYNVGTWSGNHRHRKGWRKNHTDQRFFPFGFHNCA